MAATHTPHNPYSPPGSPVVVYLHGQPVQRSKNLRGLIARAGKVGVNRAALHRGEHGSGLVYVNFADGSELWTTFADFTVARAFLRSRWKRWGLAHETRCSDDYWAFH